eukprot:746827-Alexandrium_andersonii.AAC.1
MPASPRSVGGRLQRASPAIGDDLFASHRARSNSVAPDPSMQRVTWVGECAASAARSSPEEGRMPR